MPEKQEQFKRESGVSRIVGVTPEEEQSALKGAKEIFNDMSEKEIFIGERKFKVEDLERDKTPEEKEVILGILEKMPEFVKQYGGSPINISENHIRILDINKLDEESQGKIKVEGGAGHYNSQHFIYIFPDDKILLFASKLAHEVIHFNAFQSHEKIQGEEKLMLKSRRVGLNVETRNKSGAYFHDINEAVTEELAALFGKRYFADIPALAGSVKSVEELKKIFLQKHPDRSRLAENILCILKAADNVDKVNVAFYSYPDERERLDGAIDAIYEENKDKFSQRSEVFDVFARAAMSGNLMPLARLIEKTFGKRAFRKLGELSKKK